MVSSNPAAGRQKDIYTRGFSGKRPAINISLADLEERAKAIMSPQAFAYVVGGAGIESTVRSNRSAFEQYKIIPRMLRNVSERDMSIELLRKKYSTPFLLSPIGVLELAHKKADVAVGKAASTLGVPYIFSSQASRPMEEVAAAMDSQPRWFQLYWSKSRDLVSSFVKRAEACGCEAIVVTLDTSMLGWRTRDLDQAYLPFLEGKGIAQYTSDPVFQKLMDEPDTEPAAKRNITWHSLMGLIKMVNAYPGNGFISKLSSGRPVRAVQKFISTFSNPALTWDDLKFLREQTKLPIFLKGILHPDDAQMAMDYGVDGIVISNHGGRQVDGSISTLEALPAIAATVKGRIPIILDSGIRGGADAFKALALGARAVCIGRPYVYGLAIAGQEGVEEVLRNFISDFDLTMGLSGCKNITEIKRECLQ
ncbi:MAG: lactate 2-monooxygenase [Flammeovirgaceae bacterium]|nr:lactate 2-monooxygenase [Flammeovirgaceae bacterium]